MNANTQTTASLVDEVSENEKTQVMKYSLCNAAGRFVESVDVLDVSELTFLNMIKTVNEEDPTLNVFSVPEDAFETSDLQFARALVVTFKKRGITVYLVEVQTGSWTYKEWREILDNLRYPESSKKKYFLRSRFGEAFCLPVDLEGNPSTITLGKDPSKGIYYLRGGETRFSSLEEANRAHDALLKRGIFSEVIKIRSEWSCSDWDSAVKAFRCECKWYTLRTSEGLAIPSRNGRPLFDSNPITMTMNREGTHFFLRKQAWRTNDENEAQRAVSHLRERGVFVEVIPVSKEGWEKESWLSAVSDFNDQLDEGELENRIPASESRDGSEFGSGQFEGLGELVAFA